MFDGGRSLRRIFAKEPETYDSYFNLKFLIRLSS